MGERGKGERERSGRGDPSTMRSDSRQLKGKRMKYLAECQSAPFSPSLFFFLFPLPSSLPIVHENGKVCEEFPHSIFQLPRPLCFGCGRAAALFSHAAWEEAGTLSHKTDDGAGAEPAAPRVCQCRPEESADQIGKQERCLLH